MFEFVVCVSGLVFTPIADALQLQIQQDLVMREIRANSLQPHGILKAGSKIDVPDTYRVMKGDQIDINGTLANWLAKSGYQHTNNPTLSTAGNNKDFFFPIHIVEAAYGSDVGDKFANQEYFVELRHLAKSGSLLVLNSDAKVYAWNTKSPLQTLESRQLMEKADAAQANCNCDRNGQPLGAQAQTDVAAATRAVTQAGRQPTAPVQRESQSARPVAQRTAPAGGSGIPGLGAACSRFIDRNGNYGAFGEMVLNEIRRYPIYNSETNQITRICPKFNSFDDAKKNHFWVWVYASLAQQESSCDPSVQSDPRKVSNPNGPAVGLFQMELKKSLRASRDVVYRGHFCSGNPFSPAVNIRCSARIMAGQLANGRGLYSYDPQYWGPFKSQANGIAKRSISRYPGCY